MIFQAARQADFARARFRPVHFFLRVLAVGALLFGTGLPARADVPVPPLATRITDLTGTLSSNQQAQLDQKLRAFEARKGSQIAVLIVPTTQPETIEQYSIRVVDKWKLGRKGVDDGALLLVAKDDHEVRIEVGYGLEGILPDAIANRIIRETIVPFFRHGDYFGGIQAGLDRMMRVIDGEPLPPPSQRDTAWSGLQNFLPVGLVLVFVAAGILRAIFGRLGGAIVTAGITGFVFWLIVSSILGSLFVGLVAFLFALASGQRIGYGPFGGFGGFGGIGGFGGGGFGGSGGGGFSGGGGGFGGGGASGRW